MNKAWLIWRTSGDGINACTKIIEGIFFDEKKAKQYMRYLIVFHYENFSYKLVEVNETHIFQSGEIENE